MAHEAFISYSTGDKTVADAICGALEKQGVRCWIAPRDIIAGKDWDEAIVDAIKAVRVMVLILSSRSNGSQQVIREVKVAANRGVSIIPFRIEDVKPTERLEYFLLSTHWLDAFKPPLEEHSARLAAAIRTLLAQRGGAQPAVGPPPAAAPESSAATPAPAANIACPLADPNDPSKPCPRTEIQGRARFVKHLAGAKEHGGHLYSQPEAAALAARTCGPERRRSVWMPVVLVTALALGGGILWTSSRGSVATDHPATSLHSTRPAPRPAAPPGASAGTRGRVAAGKAGIQWVSIPGGSFMMGADGGESDEKPLRRVSVKAFYLAKTEVSNKQYRACVEAGACTAPSSYVGGDDLPVVNVDWNQARKFAEWVGGRLPTEAEWEYAARSAGKDYKYPWGNEEATCERVVIARCGGAAAPACSKPDGNTAQGLCDMAGNVWEWTQDWYHASYNAAPTDASAWESPAGSARVNRGGSWGSLAGPVRSALRYGNVPGERSVDLGFRPAR